MPRRNRVDPWGDLHATRERGLFTGNRGCLVNDGGEVVRHHRGTLWIACVTKFRDWRSPLAKPGRWTPIFFLDDAVALAAGHRPCGFCRLADYRAYRDAATVGVEAARPLLSTELDRLLTSQRLRRGRGRGRGIERAHERVLWPARLDDLPSGAVIVDSDRRPRLVLGDRLYAFSFAGWHAPMNRPRHAEVEVLTPPISVAALANGFEPVLSPPVTH